MMPVIRIPDPVFERLQAIATPLVDTPADVIEKLLDLYEKHQARKLVDSRAQRAPDPPLQIEEKYPDLLHTKILAAEFDGKSASNWNDLVHLAHRRALARLGSFDALRAVSRSNITSGRRKDRGFQFVADSNISIQNVDANSAWRNTKWLAEQIKAPVRVEFEWRAKGAHAGKRATVSWTPNKSE
jgi:hypothetical protein